MPPSPPPQGIVAIISRIFGGSVSSISSFIHLHSYAALITLMTLEGASLPLPSEVIIPVAGFLAARGVLNLQLAFLAILVGNTIGMAIDYSIGYYIGKKVVYKHAKFFHIKRRTIDSFDIWFRRNGAFAVFVSRFIPEVRGLMSFPAGFAKMPLGQFFGWSIAGAAIWDFVLLLFGYYFLSGTSAAVLLLAIAIFIIILYLIYRLSMGHIKKHAKRRIRKV
jgi:membrane protein DedA with SNARE-associated domain